MPPWAQATNLDKSIVELLATARMRLRDGLALPFSMKGSSNAEIEQHSRKLPYPVPAEIAALHARIGGFSTHEAPDDCSVFLWPLAETRWLRPSEESEFDGLEEGFPEWFHARYFAFGQGIFGDALVYCPDPPGRKPGSILMLDHEGGGPEGSADQPDIVLFLADSLAQWLARWTACGLEEYGYVSGDISKLPAALRDDVRMDHMRLNPGIAGRP